MPKYLTILIALMMNGVCVFSQTSRTDSAIIINAVAKDTSLQILSDTSIDYEQLFQDFDAFMDSILTPGSYFMAGINVGKGYYNFIKAGTLGEIESVKKMTYSPIVGYYHKSGPGLTVMGYVVNDGEHQNFYQASITPSFDYLENKKFATGIAYSRYITQDSLPFYTTPIQNEFNAYFTYLKWWLRPSVSLSYGWGSRSDYMEREEIIQDLRLRRRGFTYINTKESVKDFSVTASLRHDFYWLDVLKYNDHIRITPQISFTSGTQKFGFNQTANTYATVIRTNSSVLYSTDKLYLDDQLQFQPLSLTVFLKTEYAIGKFFIQPQLTLDYYLPASTKRLNTLFSINAGFIF
ncbi:MAG: hypothetical protein IPH18_00255 [Chitinophagaceae bacterium]|nr:hypothetical protein [Chitinophagaceae bacterium]